MKKLATFFTSAGLLGAAVYCGLMLPFRACNGVDDLTLSGELKVLGITCLVVWGLTWLGNAYWTNGDA